MVKIETSSLQILNLRMLWKDSFIQKIKDRTECFIDDHFPCNQKVAIDNSMLPIGSKCLFCIYI